MLTRLVRRLPTRQVATLVLSCALALGAAFVTEVETKALFDTCQKECLCGTLECPPDGVGPTGCTCTTWNSAWFACGGSAGCEFQCGGGSEGTLCCGDLTCGEGN